MHTTDASQWTHHHDFCGDFWRSVRAMEGPNQPLGPEQNALIPVLKPSPSRQLPNSALDPLILERIVISGASQANREEPGQTQDSQGRDTGYGGVGE